MFCHTCHGVAAVTAMTSILVIISFDYSRGISYAHVFTASFVQTAYPASEASITHSPIP
jgi:hypothetical protein